MQQRSITFETKCWEGDWEFILKTNYLQRMISRNQVEFTQRILFINNVNNLAEVKRYADIKVEQRIIDKYYIVADYEDKVLEFFGLSKDSFKGGYYYSIAELTSIYLCQTEFLLHYSGDAILADDGNWINEAIKILDSNSQIKVANPCWNNKYGEAKKEAFDEVGSFYTGFGFSDQAYLIRTSDFRQRIYTETNTQSERYPKYGGELFEKRVDAWMRNNNFYRITHKHISYIHQNFPKNKLLRILRMWKLNKCSKYQ